MNIPDKAVEAAQKVLNASGGATPNEARAALEAAAPWIAAQAVKDAALDLYAIRGMVGNFEDGIRWLVDRAGALRDGL